jgi:methionine synthase II (cobalamin-independent)
MMIAEDICAARKPPWEKTPVTDAQALPRHVHLVGAIGLDTVPETYETLGRLLGERLQRVPDGEPGGRRMWIAWQFPLLRANPYLEAVPPAPGQSVIFFPFVKLANGVDPKELRFCELGYAREAMASYAEFKEAKAAGKLPGHVRFQVSLPTPYAVISAFCIPEDQAKIEPAYEAAMLRDVAKICASIPHDELALQWDVCPEMVAWDGRLPRMSNLPDPKTAIIQRLKRISEAVPEDVELGYHLCYGDVDGRHFIEPIDAGKLVELANALSAQVNRRIAYIHMPVPIERSDEDYFKPLADLKLKPGTELFLGCVHAGDGAEGTRRRIEAAGKYVSDFGIATECGMGRCKTPDVVTQLLKVHADCTRSS